MTELSRKARVALAIQCVAGRLLSPIWLPLSGLVLRWVCGYRVRDVAAVRRRYRALLADHDRPLLVCANHLTMADSALVAWGLGGTWWYLLRYARLPWNLPEYHNFAFLWVNRALAYMVKCIPVVRGGSREGVALVMAKVRLLLERGDAVLMFPEGARSRTGRIRTDSAAYGVGRMLGSVDRCSVLCVYLRGDSQKTWSTLPARGETFEIDFCVIEPTSSHRGLRRSRDLVQQVVTRLQHMEESYFADRQ